MELLAWLYILEFCNFSLCLFGNVFENFSCLDNLLQISCVIPVQDSSKPPVATTIFFGANDAALSGRVSERQHVPVEEYKENLRKMVRHLKVQT